MFEEVSRVFQESFKCDSRKLQGCFKDLSRIQDSLKDVSRKFKDCFKEVSRMF